MVLGINAIDAAQLPTELALITILKNSVMTKFKLMHAILGVMVNLTLAQVKEKFLMWENKIEIDWRKTSGALRGIRTSPQPEEKVCQERKVSARRGSGLRFYFGKLC